MASGAFAGLLMAGGVALGTLGRGRGRWAEEMEADACLIAPRLVDPEPEPYEPTAEDWAEYRAWREGTTGQDCRITCPRDRGEHCQACDHADQLEAEAMAAERDTDRAEEYDGAWYLDLVAKAANPHSGWRD